MSISKSMLRAMETDLMYAGGNCTQHEWAGKVDMVKVRE